MPLLPRPGRPTDSSKVRFSFPWSSAFIWLHLGVLCTISKVRLRNTPRVPAGSRASNLGIRARLPLLLLFSSSNTPLPPLSPPTRSPKSPLIQPHGPHPHRPSAGRFREHGAAHPVLSALSARGMDALNESFDAIVAHGQLRLLDSFRTGRSLSHRRTGRSLSPLGSGLTSQLRYYGRSYLMLKHTL